MKSLSFGALVLLNEESAFRQSVETLYVIPGISAHRFWMSKWMPLPLVFPIRVHLKASLCETPIKDGSSLALIAVCLTWEAHWTHDPGPILCFHVFFFIISLTGEVTNHCLPHHWGLLSVLSGKPSKTLWFSGFFLPPTMLRSLFECDSSSSKGFPVFMLLADPTLEPCSCGLLSRQACSVLSLSIFLCHRQEFSKTPWQSVPSALLLSKVYLLSLLQAWFPLSSIQMMPLLTFQLYSYLSRLFWNQQCRQRFELFVYRLQDFPCIPKSIMLMFPV